MDFFEAIKAAEQGYKIRKKAWVKGAYLYKDHANNCFKDNYDRCCLYIVRKCDDVWEIHDEPDSLVYYGEGDYVTAAEIFDEDCIVECGTPADPNLKKKEWSEE